MVVVAVGQQPAALEQPRRRRARSARRPARAPWSPACCGPARRAARRLQRRDLGAGSRSAPAARAQAAICSWTRFFFSTAGERELERLLGRRLEAALAAAVEVHRRRVQLQQHAGRLDRASARGRRTRAPGPGSRTRARRCIPTGSRRPARRRTAAPRRAAPRRGGRSKESSTFAALILERRPCGLSTWNDAGACASTAPTFSSPSSS